MQTVHPLGHSEGIGPKFGTWDSDGQCQITAAVSLLYSPAFSLVSLMLRQCLVLALLVTDVSLLLVLTSEAGTVLVFESTSHPKKGIELESCVFILLL